jgi:hypothetical protein
VPVRLTSISARRFGRTAPNPASRGPGLIRLVRRLRYARAAPPGWSSCRRPCRRRSYRAVRRRHPSARTLGSADRLLLIVRQRTPLVVVLRAGSEVQASRPFLSPATSICD